MRMNADFGRGGGWGGRGDGGGGGGGEGYGWGFPTWWIKLLYYIFHPSVSHKISPPFEVWWLSERQTQTDLLLLVQHYNEKLTEGRKKGKKKKEKKKDNTYY